MNHILKVDASARYQDSVTRNLANKLVQTIAADQSVIVERDVAKGLPFLDEQWINANFTPVEQRDEQAQQTLALSNALVDELINADTIVIASPIYNFGVPAALKAWIDLIARVHRTFYYTENGPVGLLENKKAYLVIASGGTPSGSEIDFATGYLKQVLKFIGISDVTVVDATRSNDLGEEKAQVAERQIKDLVAA